MKMKKGNVRWRMRALLLKQDNCVASINGPIAGHFGIYQNPEFRSEARKYFVVFWFNCNQFSVFTPVNLEDAASMIAIEIGSQLCEMAQTENVVRQRDVA